MPFLRPRFPPVAETRIDGTTMHVEVKVSTRARNYRLSVPHRGSPVLTVPGYGRWPEAQAFLDRQAGWLMARIERAPEPIPFADGAVIPVRGVLHTIRSTGRVRGTVDQRGKSLYVPGAPEHQTRRLTDWLKVEAEADLRERVAIHARTLRVNVTSLRLRSQSSRWGSCSSTGRLNFNWRLILAPPHVLDYVAAHEVAHLVEMNHSPAFWATVKRALPDMDRGRLWLKTHGRDLMAYGAEG